MPPRPRLRSIAAWALVLLVVLLWIVLVAEAPAAYTPGAQEEQSK